MECDVLVVGAGPAGSSAAAAAASKGAKVVVWEKRREVGVPIQCAGVVSEFLTHLLPFKIPEEFILWKNNEVVFSAGGVNVRRKGGIWTSYAVNRSRFDSWLAEKAVKAEAELRLETELTDLQLDSRGQVEKAMAKTNSGKELIEPKVIIAADGAASMVSKKTGVCDDNCIMGRGRLYEFADMTLTNNRADTIYFGDFIPGGYAHVFPISKNSANVGVGSILSNVNLERAFDEFCALPEIEKDLRGAKKIAERSGEVPFSYPVKEKVHENILFAGSAAGQNMKPLVEGILPAIICGTIAGETAADHIAKGTRLSTYEEKLRHKTGPIFEVTDKYIDALAQLSQSTSERNDLTMMGLCSGILSVDDFGELKNEGYGEVKRRIEVWKASRMRRLKSDLEERLWASYLRSRNLFKF